MKHLLFALALLLLLTVPTGASAPTFDVASQPTGNDLYVARAGLTVTLHQQVAEYKPFYMAHRDSLAGETIRTLRLGDTFTIEDTTYTVAQRHVYHAYGLNAYATLRAPNNIFDANTLVVRDFLAGPGAVALWTCIDVGSGPTSGRVLVVGVR